MFKNAEEVLRFIREEDVKFVDVRFCDLPGVMQHFNAPASTFWKFETVTASPTVWSTRPLRCPRRKPPSATPSAASA